MAKSRILVGTASWSDPEFVRDWYPKKMPAGDRLGWYADQFEMVEVNSSFYSVPELRMVARWCASTPEGFVFNFKLHQLLSRHSTRSKMLPPHLQKHVETDAKGRVKLTPEIEAEVIEATRPALEIFERAGKLGVLLLQLSPAFSPRKNDVGELRNILQLLAPHRVAIEIFERAGKLGVLLLQLSPAFSPRKNDVGELRNILQLLAPQRVAIEFRNRNWMADERHDEVEKFLRAHNASFVNVDAPRVNHFTVMPSDIDEVTSTEVAYLRLHGRDAKAYTTGKTVAARFNYDYSDDEIEEIAERSQSLAQRASETHIVFNNNASDYAPHAAARLRKALGQIAATPPRTAELF